MIAMICLALGLVLILEGLVYALAPSLVEEMLAALRQIPVPQRRLVGFAALLAGMALVWIAQAAGLTL